MAQNDSSARNAIEKAENVAVDQTQQTDLAAIPTKGDGPVVIDWQLSSYFGWGVYGLNLMLNWVREQKGPLLTSRPINESVIDINPIEWVLIRQSLRASRELQEQLAPLRGKGATITVPVLHALGNDFLAGGSGANDVKLTGSPTLGLIFSEETLFSAEPRERAKSYPLIVAGSTWNRDILEDAGIGPVALTLQGIDPTAFHPAPKAGLFAGRFVIFSGGKLEYRKGQDLALKAFRAFSDRHPDALLVAAWASPWPDIARSLNTSSLLSPVAFLPDGRVDLRAWVAANGIGPQQFFDLGSVPNSAMPRIYREMDVGLFTNRCEAGTNLVAMECMACGVPVILSRNTGHLDLIAPGRCFSLEHQTPIGGADHLGWGESNVEEIVETLEAVYRDRAESLDRGRRGAAFMRTMTWADTTCRLTDVVAPYL